MKRFAQLYAELDASTSTRDKLAALGRYYDQAPAQDAAWATFFLAGGKPRQVVPTSLLRAIAVRTAGLEDWLFEECYQAVGDLAETISLVLPPPQADDDSGLSEWVERLAALRGAAPDVVERQLRGYWNALDVPRRFVLGKLIGGGFRVGVSRLLVQRALAAHSGVDAKTIAQRMMGYTDGKTAPDAERFAAIVDAAPSLRATGQPYPFFLAHQLNGEPGAQLGPAAHWHVEWKYDGIRAQIVRHEQAVFVWSRGEELITERFPEVAAIGQALPQGTVLDGEILAWQDERPQPFALLQQRIGRKTLTPKVMAAAPAAFIAYDLLEEEHKDIRALGQDERRRRLERLVASLRPEEAGLLLRLSPLVQSPDWDALAALRSESRARGVEGFMLKRHDAAYGVGRTKDVGTWWKWKIDPYSIDCVLVYAQRGHGRRASLYTDFTFAVWEAATEGERKLVPFAKAYSGLTDEEFREVDAIIRKTTVEKFGPVRSVTPTQVFELGFEGIQRSSRHKSGIAVRFPRMLRWRKDKKIDEANTLADLSELLSPPPAAASSL